MNNTDLINIIQNSFCSLTNFKVRRNSLEVITAFSTLNGKFASVFITETKGQIIITDNGWIFKNYYETPISEESEDIIDRVSISFQSSFGVKSTVDKSGNKYYYKTCSSVVQIPNAVFDLANFIVGVVNSHCVQFKDEIEEIERDTFRKDANNFLKSNYDKQVKLRQYLDDFKNIRFNAIINKRSKLYLFSYVTGSTKYYFENSLRKSIVNFEISNRSKYNSLILGRIAIFNDLSGGYTPEKFSNIINLLIEKTTEKPIKWSEKEKILDII